ncbi:MAG: hypothetical protein MUP81_00605 [Dehalococcoidia bacterium]|nr:hypothetical protein [Dehalococcoidia bacterium]
MAKVTGPLYSMTASGKIADAMVFFSWKGISVVRQWLIPHNKQSVDQGDQRQILGGVGRACGAVKATSVYETKLNVAVNIPTDQTRQSYLVKRIIEAYLPTAAAFEIVNTEYEGHIAKTDFDSSALGIGLISFDVPYKGTPNSFGYGLMLYLLAKNGCDLAFSGTPYSVALASWTSTQIDLLVAELAAAA